jgi:peptidoglycan-associated lipoprotein
MKTKLTPVIASTLVLVGALLAGNACTQNPPPKKTEEPPKPAEAPATTSREVTPPPHATPPQVESGPLSGDLDQINRAGYLKDSLFDYDKSDLRDDARTALSADAEWLRKYPSVQILIEGHCDERGTSEYNLALGDRRANASKEYLASLGIDSSRVRTVSYGKERPFCTTTSEDCWQQNRRGHFVITAK